MWSTGWELNQAAAQQLRWAATASARMLAHPFNPIAYSAFGFSLAVALAGVAGLAQGYERWVEDNAANDPFEGARALPPGWPLPSAKILPFAPVRRETG